MKHLAKFIVVLMPSLLLLNACGVAGWRAPLETRGEPTPGKRSKSQSVVNNKPLVGDSSYVVRKNDTLHSIAWRSDQNFLEVARWNGITKPYTIYVGQRLRLTPPNKLVKKTSEGTPQKPKETPSAPQKDPLADKRKLAWHWPVEGKVLSGYKAGDRLRKGIKLAGRLGQGITAAESGRVVYSGNGLIGYGRLIIIKHNDQYLSAYGYNRKLLVREGQKVTKGSKIAELGKANDGRTLLHFEIRRNGKPVNPLTLLPRR